MPLELSAGLPYRDRVLGVLEEAAPQVVLTDVMMPRLDGPGLIARLRAAQVPLAGIIAMSAVADRRQVPEADRFLAKPFGLDQVLDSVAALVGAPAAVRRSGRA
jgi:CheY-like chemotaxis protein